MLREGCPHEVYTTQSIKQDLSEHFPLFPLLQHWQGLNYHEIRLDTPFVLNSIEFHPLRIISEAPPYSPFRHKPQPDHSLALFIKEQGSHRGVFYAPALGQAFNSYLQSYIQQSSCLLVDGTFWQEDEMQQAGVGTKKAQDMGHLPLSGENGMLEQLKPYPDKRRILIHINNTNPILQENSTQRAVLDNLNIEVATDAMRIEI